MTTKAVTIFAGADSTATPPAPAGYDFRRAAVRSASVPKQVLLTSPRQIPNRSDIDVATLLALDSTNRWTEGRAAGLHPLMILAFLVISRFTSSSVLGGLTDSTLETLKKRG